MKSVKPPAKNKIAEVNTILFTNDYKILAASLSLIGVLLSFFSYTILYSTPLTALGISTVIISAAAFAIAKGQPKIPPEASAVLLQASVENISSIVEEIGLKSKAIYLPSTITGDKPKALIPLDTQAILGNKQLPKRLIVKYGKNPQDVGLLIITPGSTVSNIIEHKPDSSAQDLESAISQVLLNTVNLADNVRVMMDAEKVLVEVTNPRLENSNMWIYQIIGTPVASIIASVTAQVLEKQVQIKNEQASKGKVLVEIERLGERSV
ncbi:MAG: hypothetical protein NWF01_11565 [Candidatus Bathyarchaeota archaeon]|nr:hypothetical protein [Candidatus Bathyarchaeota archaeon]